MNSDEKNVTVATVTSSKRIQIPSSVLKKIKVSEGEMLDIDYNGKLMVRRMNKDGRIRIPTPSLEVGSRANIEVKNNKIFILTE